MKILCPSLFLSLSYTHRHTLSLFHTHFHTHTKAHTNVIFLFVFEDSRHLDVNFLLPSSSRRWPTSRKREGKVNKREKENFSSQCLTWKRKIPDDWSKTRKKINWKTFSSNARERERGRLKLQKKSQGEREGNSFAKKTILDIHWLQSGDKKIFKAW